MRFGIALKYWVSGCNKGSSVGPLVPSAAGCVGGISAQVDVECAQKGCRPEESFYWQQRRTRAYVVPGYWGLAAHIITSSIYPPTYQRYIPPFRPFGHGQQVSRPTTKPGYSILRTAYPPNMCGLLKWRRCVMPAPLCRARPHKAVTMRPTRPSCIQCQVVAHHGVVSCQHCLVLGFALQPVAGSAPAATFGFGAPSTQIG